MDIGDHHGCGARGGDTAHTPADRDAHAGGLALERAEHQLRTPAEIKAGPIEVGQAVIDQRRHVGGVGDPIRLAGEQCRKLFGEIAIEVRLACGHDGSPACIHLITPAGVPHGTCTRREP